jgi:excisionase family DNA binding protein
MERQWRCLAYFACYTYCDYCVYARIALIWSCENDASDWRTRRMNAVAAEALSERLPTPDETKKASEAMSAMAKALTDDRDLSIALKEADGEVRIELPPALGELMLSVLTHVARGEMVTFVPYGAELTTQKAADLLNVSRPFLTKLLESGQIRFHRVGSHRRVRVNDLLAYKAIRDGKRESALDDLQRLGQEFDAECAK